jgi:hypothetical protein
MYVVQKNSQNQTKEADVNVGINVGIVEKSGLLKLSQLTDPISNKNRTVLKNKQEYELMISNINQILSINQISKRNDIPSVKEFDMIGFRAIALSPTLEQIAFSVAGGVVDWTAIASTENNKINVIEVGFGAKRLSWSPDGQYLAAEGVSGSGLSMISIFNALMPHKKILLELSNTNQQIFTYYDSAWINNRQIQFCVSPVLLQGTINYKHKECWVFDLQTMSYQKI